MKLVHEKDFFQKTSISLFITAFIEICMFRYMKNIHFHFQQQNASFNEIVVLFTKVHATFNNLQ